MRKVFNKLFLAILLLFPISVFAAGSVSVSPTSLTIEEGSSKTFTISAYNTIGDVSISSSNSGVASVSTGEWGTGMVDEGQTKTGTITVTGKSVGTATITLTIDAATFDGDDLAGQTRTVTVNVVAKPTPPSNNNNNNSNNNNSNNNQATDNRSKNNNIKELTIEGYELTKVDDNNYNLTVSNDVTSVNVMATAEDSKAKISGAGVKELQIGENNIEVVVTSESGTQNKITIKVTRKDGYYLEDLDSVLNDSKIQDINIIINPDSKISSQDLTKIKASGKIVKLNYYDENKKLIYSYVLDGTKIKDVNEFVTSVSYTSENVEDILKLSNYADGLYISLGQNGNLPKNTKIKLYVGDKYIDGDIVNVYYYDKGNNKLDFVKDNLTVKDGYVEFEVEKGSDYLITMSNITSVNKKEINIFMIISIIELIVIVVLVIIYFLKIKPIILNNKEHLSNNVVENNTEDDVNILK